MSDSNIRSPVKLKSPHRASAQGEPLHPRSAPAQSGHLDCPPVEKLWPVAVGERMPQSVAVHLEQCSACRQRTRELSGEIDQTRMLVGSSHRMGGGSTVLTQEKRSRSDLSPGSGACELERTGPSDQDAPPPSLSMIGKYYVLETICESGQATVYRGLHPSLLIEVVIKLAHVPLEEDESGRARLIAEAKALAEVEHPDLARLYDLDFFENRPFLVLEYVRGRHLRQFRESTTIDASKIAFLVARIARAVEAAHQRGVLHLDLKPENILVTPHGDPVLIDFGMSFLTSQNEKQAKQDRCIAGTPQYMAPEQIDGLRDGFSQRTDVYGLGGVLYYLCVGHDPFVVSRVDGEFQRSSEPDWRALSRTHVPSRLKRICRRALATDPSVRYRSAEVLAETLEEAERRWTGPALRRLRARALTLSVLGIISLIASLCLPASSPPFPPSLEIQVVRPASGGAVPLQQALPLREQEQVRIEGSVDESSHVAAFALYDGHSPQWLGPLQTVSNAKKVRVAYPGWSDSIPLSCPGRVLLLVLVSRQDSPIRREDVDELRLPNLDGLSLPHESAIKFGQKRSDLHLSSGSSVTRAQQRNIDRLIQSVQNQLSSRFNAFEGILIVLKE